AISPELLLPAVEDAAPLTPLAVVVWRQGELWKTAALGLLWAVAIAGMALAPRRPAMAALALLPLVVDLALFGARYDPLVSADRVRHVPPALEFLKAQGQTQAGNGRVIALGDGLLPNAATLYGIPDFRVYEPVAHYRMLRYF